MKRTVQCAKCPWIKGIDPLDIPNGYTVEKHLALRSTIADRNNPLASLNGDQHVMACHELEDAHCIGWLVNQIGVGNNIAMRMRMRDCDNAGAIRVRGEQHASFDDTLPAIAESGT
ncbi:MAG: hypothetical protein OSA97_05745 [Nevskia sp.]|nr:hypothetical protein [Nevskia sp.]